jgi:hypothetical protein
MSDTETSLIIASNRDLPTFSFNPPAIEAKRLALERAALIAKVTDRDSKIIAVRAQTELKKVFTSFEKARLEKTEPLLNAQRAFKRMVDLEKLPLEQEYERVSRVVAVFDEEERCRVADEERKQREELARIEREKQAELDRIAREQREREEAARRAQQEIDRKAREAKETAERKAREEREAAEKLAREATNKKQREAAEKARLEAEQRAAAAKIESDKAEAAAKAERERVEADLRHQAEASAAQTAAVEEKAGDAAYCASRPPEITKVQGQRTTCDWEITKINDWILAKARPDLVSKITFDMRALKDELKRGNKLPGVEAREVFTAGVKLTPDRKAIDI